MNKAINILSLIVSVYSASQVHSDFYHGTLLVVLSCSDGLVIVCDRRITDNNTGNVIDNWQKLFRAGDNAFVVTTGNIRGENSANTLKFRPSENLIEFLGDKDPDFSDAGIERLRSHINLQTDKYFNSLPSNLWPKQSSDYFSQTFVGKYDNNRRSFVVCRFMTKIIPSLGIFKSNVISGGFLFNSNSFTYIYGGNDKVINLAKNDDRFKIEIEGSPLKIMLAGNIKAIPSLKQAIEMAEAAVTFTHRHYKVANLNKPDVGLEVDIALIDNKGKFRWLEQVKNLNSQSQ